MLEVEEQRRAAMMKQREEDRRMQKEMRRRKMEEDKRRRAENLDKIKRLSAAPNRNRTLYNRMEKEYQTHAARAEELRRAQALEERHRIYQQPWPSARRSCNTCTLRQRCGACRARRAFQTTMKRHGLGQKRRKNIDAFSLILCAVQPAGDATQEAATTARHGKAAA
eukprot:scaffold176602_cov54-Prasinocladus_malaysianus.AAC.2